MYPPLTDHGSTAAAVSRAQAMCSIELDVLPDGHRADVERGVPIADGPKRAVRVLRRAVKGFEQDMTRRMTQIDQAPNERVDQLVRELAHEMAFPVVPVLAVRRVEQPLLVDERLRSDAVVDESRRGAERALPGSPEPV